MAKIVGTYLHERNENLDEYYQKLDVPYIARKMMSMTSPKLVIQNEDDEWTISTSTILRTLSVKFKLGEEYEEDMPKGALKSITTLENDSLKTVSIGPNDTKITRTYELTDDGLVNTMRHDESGVEGKRYFKRETAP